MRRVGNMHAGGGGHACGRVRNMHAGGGEHACGRWGTCMRKGGNMHARGEEHAGGGEEQHAGWVRVLLWVDAGLGRVLV